MGLSDEQFGNSNKNFRNVSFDVTDGYQTITAIDEVVVTITEHGDEIDYDREEHTVTGGFGSAICELAAETGSGCRVKRVGLEDCFTTVVGDRQYLREIYGMDGKAIAEKAEALLKE